MVKRIRYIIYIGIDKYWTEDISLENSLTDIKRSAY